MKNRDLLQDKYVAAYADLAAQCEKQGIDKSLLDNVLSLSRQLSVEPTLLNIPEKEVLKEYDGANIRIILCKSCIIWQNKGGYMTIVRPEMRTLHSFLLTLCKMKDKYDNLTEEGKETCDGMYFGMGMIQMLPLIATLDGGLFKEIVFYIVDTWEKTGQELINRPLEEEDFAANADFNNFSDLLDFLKDAIDNKN